MKYNQGIIYKICCNDTDVKDIYVGSTTNFIHRKYSHKSSCNNSNSVKYDLNVYQFVRDNGGWDNWSMIQIEQYEAKDKRDLEQRERYYSETLKATLNRQLPTRTQKEWYENNIDTHKENCKKRYKNNKESIAIIQKKYRDNNKQKIKELKSKKYMCECGGRYTHSVKARHLQTKKHKEYILSNPNTFTV